MLRVLSCIAQEHDLTLVLTAALICAVGAGIAMRLFTRARDSMDLSRAGWLFLVAVAAGASIWTTHFIAMLAFQPRLPTAFDPGLTIASLFIALATTGLGFTIATFRSPRISPEIGGALVGLGIAAMHFTGMAAYRTAGVVQWDMAYVAASVLIGAALGSVALNLVTRQDGMLRCYGAAAAFAFAIVGMHFTAMAAARIIPDPTILVPVQLMSEADLALSVVSVAILVIGTGLSSYAIDSRAKSEASSRLRQLSDATIEGVIITDGERVIDVNSALEALAGRPRADVLGKLVFDELLDVDGPLPALGGEVTECRLRTSAGDDIPVEVIARELTAGEYRLVYAVRDLRERRASEGRIRYLADNDALTGLPNRHSFERVLDWLVEDAERNGSGLAVAKFDLDRFKEINDIHSHAAGDRILMEISRRLTACLQDGEFLARLGGDEFAAVQPADPQPERAADLAQRIVDAVRGPYQVSGGDIRVEVSVGIACYPQDGLCRDHLMANADIAMQRSRSSTDFPLCFFEHHMDTVIRQRRALARELANAVERGELELLYQMQNAVGTCEVTGFEALLRWRHGTRGLVSPVDFVPIAEETGLIVGIGEWVLRTACREAAGWERPYRVAVNVSPMQFRQRDLPEQVHAILLETGLAPSRLELEITESTIIDDTEGARQILRRLKALGVSIAIDDFGTGYSSLHTLQAFPFDKIKIDRSFVDQVMVRDEAAIIVRTILSLGANLSIPVLAEGVETQEQLAFLDAEGCREAQGYYFGRPVPAEHARALAAGAPVDASLSEPRRRIAG